MEVPEDLRELVDRLGQALIQALVTDEKCRELARQIQESGYEVGLMLEATLALHRREEESQEPGEPEPGAPARPAEAALWRTPEQDRPQWSDEDRAFLQKFKISLD